MISSIIRARRCKSVKGNVPLWWCLWDTWDKKRLGNTVLIFHSSRDSIMCRVLDPDVIPEMSSSATSLQNKHKLHDVCCRITSFPSQHGCPLWFCSVLMGPMCLSVSLFWLSNSPSVCFTACHVRVDEELTSCGYSRWLSWVFFVPGVVFLWYNHETDG